MAEPLRDHLLELQKAFIEGRITQDVYDKLKTDISESQVATPRPSPEYDSAGWYDRIQQERLSGLHVLWLVFNGLGLGLLQTALLFAGAVAVTFGIWIGAEYVFQGPAPVLGCTVFIALSLLTLFYGFGFISSNISYELFNAKSIKYERTHGERGTAVIRGRSTTA